MLVFLMLPACQTTSGGSPDGPLVDFTALRGDLDALLGGAQGDSIADGGMEPCAIDGEPFTLTMDVTGPNRCGQGAHNAPQDCTRARTGRYAWNGTLQIGDDPAMPLDGVVWLWSMHDGPSVHVDSLVKPIVDFPHETLDILLDGYTVDDARFVGLDWGRRLSEDSDPVTVWELCSLQLAP